jgi:hypothetical protein
MVPVYTWLDPHRASYGFGYCFSLVPGRTRPHSGGGCPHHCLVFGGGPWAGGVVTVILFTTSGGGCPCHKKITPGPLNWRTQGMTYSCILEVAMPVGESPCMMVTAARQIVATSDVTAASLAIRWQSLNVAGHHALILRCMQAGGMVTAA